MEVKNCVFDTELFELKQLADGIYAAIEKGREMVGSNAGFFRFGDDVIVFDTFLNIDGAEQLKNACLSYTGKMPTFIINSHSHSDHFIGNCVFPSSVRIISSKPARDSMLLVKSDLEQERSQYESRLNEIDESLKTAQDKTELQNLHNERFFISNMLKPAVPVRVADMTLEGELVIIKENRRLILKVFPVGHSAGDMIAVLPEDKICYTGDLLFIDSHPWIGSGDPEKLIAILEELLAYDIDHYVPGHGTIASKKDVELQIQYIKEILNLVDQKKSIEGAVFRTDELSPIFHNWSDLCFQWNINALMKRAKEQG